MKKYGLIGEKLGHSYSPEIHALLGDYEYRLYPMPREAVGDFVQKGGLSGFNVTIPYKETVMPFLDRISPEARRIGSVNTVVREADGSTSGYNTDYFGFSVELGDVSHLKGKKALVLGSGGASKTVRAVLGDAGLSPVVTISRKGPDNYQNLSRHSDAALIVNTTPVGMYPAVEASPIDLRQFPSCQLALDLIYNPAWTEFLLQARELGIPCRGGLIMLAAQARKAAELFGAIAPGVIRDEDVADEVSRQNRSIALIGMPGCGKTSVGRALAEITGRQLIDTDERIRQEIDMPIPEYFARFGEPAFRKIESRILAEAAKESRAVIATGGGIVTVPENRRSLLRNCQVVYLRRSLDQLPDFGRPVTQKTGVEALFAQRKALYEGWADDIVDNVGIEATAEILKNRISGGVK